jgi:hypothetical protein
MNQLKRFNLGIAGEADCPVFDDMFKYCQVCIHALEGRMRVHEARAGAVALGDVQYRAGGTHATGASSDLLGTAARTDEYVLTI